MYGNQQKKTLPNKRNRTKKIHEEQQGKEETIAYKQMQLIRKLLAKVKRKNTTNDWLPQDIDFIKGKIEELQEGVDMEIPHFPETLESNNIGSWTKEMWAIWKTIFKSKQIAQHIYMRKKIEQAIDRRCMDMDSDPSRMINNILERGKKSLVINNLIEFDENNNPTMVTEPEKILKQKSTLEKQLNKEI